MGAADLAGGTVSGPYIDDTSAICDHILGQAPVGLHAGAVGGGAACDNHANQSL